MEKRPLSKLAITGFILSLVAPLFTIGIIVTLIFNSPIELHLENYIWLIIIASFILSISALIISIGSLIQIKRNNLRGKTFSIIGIILSIISILLYGWLGWIKFTMREYGGHNGSSAVAALKLLNSAEATWFQQDCDGNGIKDYWTYDVSCLHRMLRSNYSIKVAFIPIDLARADMAPASMAGGVTPFGTPKIESWLEMTLEPKSGYCFMAMLSDENGIPYNQNPVGPNKIPATNSRKYAFVAYPAVYDISGINTFIVNQEGTIYARNMGRDDRKIVLRWPDANEMKKWRIAD